MGVHVDETRRQHQAVGLDLRFGTGAAGIANQGDAAVQKADVGDESGLAAAIDQGCAANQRIEMRHGSVSQG
ncbi:hypothetical protein D3C80_1974610 [compost metagenome]